MRLQINLKMFRKIIILPFVLLIKFYRLAISPLTPSSCRHTPTCSQYAIEAFQMHGLLKGLWLATRRLSKCHPWGTYGYDPVPKVFPEKIDKKKDK